MQLVVLAFFLVVAPLGVLIYQATDSMVTLSRQGREHAKEALDFFSRSQHLRELSGDLVRSARQYDVLKKTQIEDRFRSQLSEYKTLLQLHSFLIDSDNIETIFTLISALETLPLNTATGDKVSQLVPLTQTLYDDTRKKLDQRLEFLNAKAEEQQNILWLQAGLLITLSTILILFFSIRITQPVKQLMLRIKALGHGRLDMSEPFKGPKEFLALNQQLEWLETHLQLLEQEKQAFLRHMSHELKTPLTTLREGTDLLAEELAGPLTDNQKEIISLMQENSFSLQSLIEQLLDYNRLQHGGEHELKDQFILPIIQQSLTSHQLLLKQKHMHVTLPQQDLSWAIDKDLLQRTLSNLISNAAVYGSENGLLKITLLRQHNDLKIEIGNTGPEIPQTDLAQLFDPFYQGVNRRQGSVKGSGIGLSIARESIKAMGGTLELHSNQDGFVSFMITLPNLGQTIDE
ncbi:HAMP domain-containing sensor histidine kinase [Amphritea sp. 1_MG-2023]|uniref:sensor histidine kinase n=1 Tax=Amphritea sp. 1_MG-2023 TaxID=3062670 RepID=UPI0026E39AEA|nr:HAMP domain-containing sensor histidine kinase [Amphritea sp. 1_MG-2023]MDO6562197.1 HAMP domain-containing sensor histidine kinase [Amphritea sp. 1_MG-2023]